MLNWKKVPTFDELNWPSLQALRAAGGSATIAEHLAKLIELFDIPEAISLKPHGDTGRSELEYRLAWSRTALRHGGLVENSARGIWSVTTAGEHATEKDVTQRINDARAAYGRPRDTRPKSGTVLSSSDKHVPNDEPALAESGREDWEDTLLRVLRDLSPAAFERLTQRMLRESGFSKVEVTGRSGDGGIDGTGILQLSLMSFPVLFQCKRYQGSVGPATIRDFRGAMTGRTDKGLIVTTGTFTSEARREATRDGAPPVELIDGQQLCEHLRQLKLGIVVRLVEEIEVDTNWFSQLN